MALKCPFRSCLALAACWAVIAAPNLARAQANPALEGVLNDMDRAQQTFRSAEADFTWDVYTSVVQETDTQKGKVYYRRRGDEIQMALELKDPKAPKFVLFVGGKLQIFSPVTDQVTVVDTEKNHAAFESFLALGFGGGGHAMEKPWEIQYLGTEKIDGVDAAKLDLTPKSQKVKNMFPHILLWIDRTKGVSVQQQLFEPEGDYRLAKYSNIQINGRRIPESVFKLKTDAKTTYQTSSVGADSTK